eukprot:COSAG02_NODE_18658_length_926_cov_1.688029_1_plen_238_part_00
MCPYDQNYGTFLRSLDCSYILRSHDPPPIHGNHSQFTTDPRLAVPATSFLRCIAEQRHHARKNPRISILTPRIIARNQHQAQSLHRAPPDPRLASREMLGSLRYRESTEKSAAPFEHPHSCSRTVRIAHVWGCRLFTGFIWAQSVPEFLWDRLRASIQFPVIPKRAQYRPCSSSMWGFSQRNYDERMSVGTLGHGRESHSTAVSYLQTKQSLASSFKTTADNYIFLSYYVILSISAN